MSQGPGHPELPIQVFDTQTHSTSAKRKAAWGRQSKSLPVLFFFLFLINLVVTVARAGRGPHHLIRAAGQHRR